MCGALVCYVWVPAKWCAGWNGRGYFGNDLKNTLDRWAGVFYNNCINTNDTVNTVNTIDTECECPGGISGIHGRGDFRGT